MGIDQTSPASLAVWIITLGESVTKEDFEKCSKAVDKSCVPKHSYLKGEAAWRYIVGCLLPQMVMRRRHIPREKWAFFKTKVMEATGKPYIAFKSDPVQVAYEDQYAMGFSSADAGSAMVFAHSIGPKFQVINLGVGIKPTTMPVSAEAYVQSHLHQITANEEKHLSLSSHPPDVSVRRLNITMAIKDAYIRAIGQPVGFDYSRIDVSVPTSTILVDAQPLSGWHIRLFIANLPRSDVLLQKGACMQYQVAIACFRGMKGMKFSFDDGKGGEEMNKWVSFFDVKEVVRAVPRLGEYDGVGGSLPGAMPPLDYIPLSGKNSMASMATITAKGKERAYVPVQETYEYDRMGEKARYEIQAQPQLPTIKQHSLPGGGYPTKSAYSSSSSTLGQYQPTQTYQPQPLSHSQTMPTHSSSGRTHAYQGSNANYSSRVR